MTVLRKRLLIAAARRRRPRPLPRLLPAHRRPRRGDLHRPPLQGDDRRRRVAADRLGEHQQPLDGHGHRMRRRRRGARRQRASRRRSAAFRDRCSPSTWAWSPAACSERSASAARSRGAIEALRLAERARCAARGTSRSVRKPRSRAASSPIPEQPVTIDRLVDAVRAERLGPAARRGSCVGQVRASRLVLVGLALPGASRRSPMASPPSERHALGAGVRRQLVGAARGRCRAYTPAASSCSRARSSRSRPCRVRRLARLRLRDDRHPAGGARHLFRRPPRSPRYRAALAGRKLDRLSTVLAAAGLVAMTAVRLVPLAPFRWWASSPARSASGCGTSRSARVSASCPGCWRRPCSPTRSRRSSTTRQGSTGGWSGQRSSSSSSARSRCGNGSGTPTSQPSGIKRPANRA